MKKELRIVCILVLLVTACGQQPGSLNGDQPEGEFGILSATLIWPETPNAKAELPGTEPLRATSFPATVTTIRMQVSGEGMDTKTRDFNAADKTGTISGIPVGNRTVLFEGLNSADKAIYRGLPTTVVVQSDVTVEVEVEMEAL